MQIIHFKNKKIVLPGGYNELSAKQLFEIASLQQKERADTDDILKLKALKILLGYSRLRFFLLNDDIKSRLIDGLIDWVFKENTLTEQLVPTYKGFHGPKREFDNISLAEFHFAEIYYEEFVKGDDAEKEEALSKLVAVLYRVPKDKYNLELDPDGDSRQHFNSNVLPFFSKKTARWPRKVKLAILMFYDGCRQHFANSYNTIFKEGNGSDQEAGMFTIIRGLAGTKYGDFDKVESLNVHTALNELETQIEEASNLRI